MPETIPDLDLYAVLGVAPDADADAIRAAHREAVRRAHPDVAGNDDELAKRLNVARDWLTDPGRRARYDAVRRASHGDLPHGRAGPDGVMAATSSPSVEVGLADRPSRSDAIGCLELGWWLLLIIAAALIFALLLLIVADF